MTGVSNVSAREWRRDSPHVGSHVFSELTTQLSHNGISPQSVGSKQFWIAWAQTLLDLRGPPEHLLDALSFSIRTGFLKFEYDGVSETL
jgi:hypothetical protein